MLDIKQFRDNIVKPIVEYLGFDKTNQEIANATYLLLATAIHESRLSWLKQISGPALGVYQIEPTTVDFLMERIKKNKELSNKFDALIIHGLDIYKNVIGNLYFATAMARFYYRTKPGKLPTITKSNIDGWLANAANYWKKHYNTHLGKGTENDFVYSNSVLKRIIAEDPSLPL